MTAHPQTMKANPKMHYKQDFGCKCKPIRWSGECFTCPWVKCGHDEKAYKATPVLLKSSWTAND
jgi:hypothetical protein